MTKVNIHTRFISRFISTIILAILAGSWVKADVIYTIPLKGVEHEMGNLLEWSTAYEQNSQTFIIEKSTNGTDFEKAGIQDAAGSSYDDKNYRFLDLGVNDKQLYYRLKQIDIDGTSSFSQTILIKKELSNQFMVVAMSSPEASERFDITIDALEKVAVKYSVKNKNGDIIFNDQQTLLKGLNDIEFDLKDEKEGFFYISLQVDKEEEHLVIQKIDDPKKKKTNFASKPLKKGG